MGTNEKINYNIKKRKEEEELYKQYQLSLPLRMQNNQDNEEFIPSLILRGNEKKKYYLVK